MPQAFVTFVTLFYGVTRAPTPEPPIWDWQNVPDRWSAACVFFGQGELVGFDKVIERGLEVAFVAKVVLE